MQVCGRCGERNPDRARFCMLCATPLATLGALEESRRIVTVLFADLKGSTSIGERLDPEAVRRVLTRFYDAARHVIERHGGTVEKFIGDAVMAVFGVPRAHEDDALRGVRAASELQEVLGRMNDDLLRARYGVGLELRIGVNTGEVVAGDPATGSSFVAGDAVNVGARLEQAAPPGGVLLGEETYRQVAHLVETSAVESLTLKGKAETVPAFRLLGMREGVVLADAAPLIGRADERDALDAAFGLARERSGCVRAIVSGPPGMGKTRIGEDALQRYAAPGEHMLVTHCAPEGEGDPMDPLRDLLRSALDLPPRSAGAAIRAQVERLMAGRERAPVVVATAIRTLSSDERGIPEDVGWMMSEVLAALARVRPLAIVIDDLQWARPEVRDTLDEVADRADGPLLLVLTTLPESHVGPAGDIPSVTIDLLPLSRADSRTLLRAVGGDAIGSAAEDRALDAAEGNPLFLIETARILTERAASDDADAGSVPITIRGLIAARLDQLPSSEARLLETASIIGRAFPVEGLRGTSSSDVEPEVAALLASLLARQVLISSGDPDTLTFSHRLVRDVAYESLTKERRAELHERYAKWCEAQGTMTNAVIAHHLELSFRLRNELGSPDPHDRALGARAVQALADAGEDALASSSRGAAAELAQRARAVAELLPEDGAGADARVAAGHLAFLLGDWPATIGLMDRPGINNGLRVRYELGVALAQSFRLQTESPQLGRARELLEDVLERSGEADAAATLAGTWRGVDDDRALGLYRRAVELDPAASYPLGNVVEYEVVSSGGLDLPAPLQASLNAAAERCLEQIQQHQNQPWAAFDLAKFSLLRGDDAAALSAACLAVEQSSAGYMLSTSLASLERLMAASGARSGLERVMTLYRLALAGAFNDTEMREMLDKGASELTFRPPIVIIAGGSSAETVDHIAGYGAAIIAAMTGIGGTIVSGGTTQGVSALAGDIGAANAEVRSLAYLPAVLPDGVAEDDDPQRYAARRRTDGIDFSVDEALLYWTDLISSGERTSEVRVLAIGGGGISAAEYRLGLALGARVGAFSGSRGAAADLLRDPWWAANARLVEIAPDADAIRSFLAP